MLFDDEVSAKKIMDTSNPKEQKALGRRVHPFDPNVWKEQCRDIVEKGNLAKVIGNWTDNYSQAFRQDWF